jgi:O-antigen/teichoic acid export membrane protein
MTMIARDGFLFSLLMAGPILSFQGNILIVSHNLGASAILGYLLMRTLVNFLSTSLFSLGRVLWPEISIIRINKNSSVFKELNIMLIKVSASIGCIFSAFLFFAGSDVIAFWSGVDNLLSEEVVMILSISIISKAIYCGSSISCMALSKHRILTMNQLIGGLVIIVLTIFLTPRYGLIGASLAFAIPDILFFTIPSLLISMRLSDLSSTSITNEILIPLLNIFVLLVIISWVLYVPLIGREWSLPISSIIYFPIAGIIVFWMALNNTERFEVKRMARHLLYKLNTNG